MTDNSITENDTVLADLSSLKEEIYCLDEMLNDEDYGKDEILMCCQKIEELALTIRNETEGK